MLFYIIFNLIEFIFLLLVAIKKTSFVSFGVKDKKQINFI